MASPPKIGFIVNGKAIPAWYAETIRAVVEKAYAVFFVLKEGRRDQEEKEKKSFVLKAFETFEERWFRSEHDAMKPVSIEPWMKKGNVIEWKEESAIEEINHWGLDVLYTISSIAADAQQLAEAAAYGLWAIHFGPLSDGQTTAAFWAVIKDEPVTQSSLLVYKAGLCFVGYEGSTVTVPYSVKNNFSSVAWKASSYLPLRLATLQSSAESFFTKRRTVSFSQTKNALPGNTGMLWFWARNTTRYLRYKIAERVKKGRFTILYSNTDFDLSSLPSTRFTSLPLPNTKGFYADPFVMERDGINYIFFEEMDEAKEKAHISVITINQNKKASKSTIVLEKPYHLSYPFVFSHEGKQYMVPETASNKTVELYTAKAFPHEWTFVMNLMEGVELLDATLHFEGKKWWLFAAASNHPFVSTNDQLFLFYSDDLFSMQWTAHPQNPVATHAANCRPAGRIFKHKGKLYRPAQNNASQQYGYGLKINEIEVLSEEVYKEKEVLSILPETFGLKACHHLDFSSSLVVMDGKPPNPLKGAYASET